MVVSFLKAKSYRNQFLQDTVLFGTWLSCPICIPPKSALLFEWFARIIDILLWMLGSASTNHIANWSCLPWAQATRCCAHNAMSNSGGSHPSTQKRRPQDEKGDLRTIRIIHTPSIHQCHNCRCDTHHQIWRLSTGLHVYIFRNTQQAHEKANVSTSQSAKTG